MNQKLIKDLQERRIYLIYNRESSEDLKRVLKAAFPFDVFAKYAPPNYFNNSYKIFNPEIGGTTWSVNEVDLANTGITKGVPLKNFLEDTYTLEELKDKEIAIHCETQEEWVRICKMTNFGDEGTIKSFNCSDGLGKDGTPINCISLYNGKGYSCKEFYMNRGYKIIPSYQVDTKVEKKVIGYKAPYNLFGDRVKGGVLYQRYVDNYSPVEWDRDYHETHFKLPKEIVEKWEPVYEDTTKYETVIIGDSHKITINNKRQIKGERTYTITDWEKLYERVTFNPFKMNVNNITQIGYPVSLDKASLTIGCVANITLKQIKAVIDTYYQLNPQI